MTGQLALELSPASAGEQLSLDDVTAEPEHRLVLIGCTKTKRAERCAAFELYDPSDLFRRRLGYARSTGLPFAILSAGAGVLTPWQSIEPYNVTIAQRMKADHYPRAWAIGCIQSAARILGLDLRRPNRMVLEVHAGIDYVRTLELARIAFPSLDLVIVHPVAGLGIGAQKAHYSR